MPQNLFLQNVVALIWDFDKTLTPMYMQEPIFKHFKVDSGQFWGEVDGIPAFYKNNGLNRVESDTVYLNHILTYVNKGIFAGLNNKLLKELGKQIKFYPGLPEFFPNLKELIEQNKEFSQYEIKVEHYIVSTGLRQMILGSAIADYVDDVWGCEFVETVPPPKYDKTPYPLEAENRVISQIGYIINNTTKTRAVFEINKGTNKHPEIGVNVSIAPEKRRIPFEKMVCIADGPSDIPMFSLIKSKGGRTFAVYRAGSRTEFNQVNDLQRQGRIESCGEANYTEGSKTFLWITGAVEEIAKRIAEERTRWFKNHIGKPPKHITKD